MDVGGSIRGALALFGLLVLPGLALAPLVRFGSRTERALFLLATSLAANAYGALLLNLAGIYTRAAVLCLFAGWVPARRASSIQASEALRAD